MSEPEPPPVEEVPQPTYEQGEEGEAVVTIVPIPNPPPENPPRPILP